MLQILAFSACMWLQCSGTYLGPDFVMNIDANNDQAQIAWTDGKSARVQFVAIVETRSGGSIFKGAVIQSTDSANKATPGDIVILNFESNLLDVLRPDYLERWTAPACWQGFNLEAGRHLYPSM